MPINWKGIKTTGNRFYDANRIAEINDSLQYLPAKQRAAVIGTIIEESGGDPLARSEKGTYQGLLQWGADRYKIQSNDARKELANQLSTLRSTINNTTDKKSWSHGGTGSGYNSFQEAYDTFHDKDAPLEDVYRAFSFGYVRPKGKEASYKNRLEVTKQVYPKVLADDVVKNSAKAVGIIGDLMHMNEWKDGGAINNRPTWDKLSMAERADVMKLAIEGGVYDLDAIRSGYNKFAEGGSKKEGVKDNTDTQYINTMERVAEENYKKWGYSNPDEALIHALNDNTYNYRGYYEKYPQSAANADTHWPDEFKTVYHPTFSNESIYSGKKSQYNPNGRIGGFWLSEDLFVPAPWQLFNNYAEGGPTDPPVDPLVAPLDIDLNLDPIGYEMPQEEEPVMKVSAKVADEIASPKAFTPAIAKNDVRNFYVNDFAQRRQKYHPTETPTQVVNLFDNASVAFDNTDSGTGGLYNTKSGNITISDGLNNNSKRSSVVHEMRHLMDDKLGGLTPEESQMLHDAYNLKARKGYQHLEDEYPTTNTELRYQISRDHNNALGEDLNKVIQGLSDSDLIQRSFWVNGYNQISDKILTPKNDKQRLEQKKKADAIRKALMEVAFNPIQTPFNYAAEGGSIHIAPSKRGTFTAAASRHGKSVQAFASQVLAHKENYSPAMVKKANFARNASHWKHGEGGNLYPSGGFMGLLPAMPGIALTPSSNTLNIAKAAVKGAGRGISSFITGEGEPLREAGIAFIQNLNTQNKADALDAAMHSTQGGEVMGTNDLINIGIPNYFRKLTGQPMDINYTGSYLADGITPNVKRDLVNLYLKGDKTGFEDVTNNAFYNNGPDYVKYFRENYPNIKPRTYKMSSDGVPLELSEEEYAAATKNLNKNLRMKEDSRSNADNVANFNRWYKMIDGKLYAIDSDVWDFNPKDWAWEKGDEEMANSNGTPFILKAIRPIIKKKAIKRKALGGNLFSGEEGLI